MTQDEMAERWIGRIKDYRTSGEPVATWCERSQGCLRPSIEAPLLPNNIRRRRSLSYRNITNLSTRGQDRAGEGKPTGSRESKADQHRTPDSKNAAVRTVMSNAFTAQSRPLARLVMPTTRKRPGNEIKIPPGAAAFWRGRTHVGPFL